MPCLKVPLEKQVYAYWRASLALRSSVATGGEIGADFEELLDLGDFTDHPRLRRAVEANAAAAFADPRCAEAVSSWRARVIDYVGLQ